MDSKQAVGVQFKDWEGLAKKLAHRFRYAVARQGHRISFDDAYSEVCLRWVLARDGFDPDRGFSFATYFTAAVNYWVRPYVKSRREDAQSNRALRFDDNVKHGGEGDVGLKLHEIIEDTTTRGAAQSVERQELIKCLKIKAPLVHRMLELVSEQPADLMRELDAAVAQQSYARSLGVSCNNRAPTQLTPKTLGKIFGFNWKHRLQLQQEMEEMVKS